MTTEQKGARRKLSLLELAHELSNVSKACKVMGYSRQQFYEIHRTLLDEHFRVEGRRTWFETVDEMQLSLDSYLAYHNEKRPHQGRGMNGRTPLDAFIEGIQNTDEKDRDDASKDPTSVTAA